MNTSLMNESKEEKQMKKIIGEIVMKEKSGCMRNKTIVKSESKSTNRFNKDLIFINNNLSKNVLHNNPLKDSNTYLRSLKNQLKSIDLIKSIDDSSNKKVMKKPQKQLKYLSEVFQEKHTDKNSSSIKTNPIILTTVKPLILTKKVETSNNNRKKANDQPKVSNVNSKRFIKSHIFLENFKNYREKVSGKSITKAVSQVGINCKINSNSVDKFSIDPAIALNSTKSNSFASYASNNNNTFSNSLKYLNLKSQLSTNNTIESSLSNNSFLQTKDLKTKFSGIHIDKAKTASTCSVVISLNTNKNKNKTNISTLLGPEKKSVVEGKNSGINKNVKKK